MSTNDSSQCEGWRRSAGREPARCTAPATHKITIAAADNGDLPDYLRDQSPSIINLCDDCAREYREHNSHRILCDDAINSCQLQCDLTTCSRPATTRMVFQGDDTARYYCDKHAGWQRALATSMNERLFGVTIATDEPLDAEAGAVAEVA